MWTKKMVHDYPEAHFKPDKAYSIIPTILRLAQPSGMMIEVGCGDGVVCRALMSTGAEYIIGIDNQPEQVSRAQSFPVEGVEYRLADMFTAELGPVDCVVAAFVPNYATNKEQLDQLFYRFASWLKPGGRLVLVVDQPEGRDLRQFGAVKTLFGPAVDGTPILIDLYREEKRICRIENQAHYFTRESVNRALWSAGFESVERHQPIISEEGFQEFGNAFWEGYVEHPELDYVTAVKAGLK